MRNTVKAQIWNLAKLGLAGATIFGIAWAISVGDPEDGVQEAQADIATWASTKTIFGGGNFGKTIEASGMKPRAYEMNGNQVFFAVGYVKEDPQEVLDYYQEEFVAAGVNKRKFLDVPEEKFKRTIGGMGKAQQLTEEELDYNEALLTGGVVPLTTRPGYVAMGGMVPKERVSDIDELIEDWKANDTNNIYRQMDGFRFLDAQQFPGQIGSRVTSVWADESFDAEKMAHPEKNAGPPVLSTPVCMGCSVGMQMRSLDTSEKFRIGHFYSQRSRDDLVNFYDHAMPRKGFESGDANKAIDLARRYLGAEVPPGAVLQFTHGGAESLVTIFDDKRLGETSVIVVESL